MRSNHSGYTRLTTFHKVSALALVATGAAALAFTATGNAAAAETQPVGVKPVAWNAKAPATVDRSTLTRHAADAASRAKTDAAAKKPAAAQATAKAEKDRAAKNTTASRSTARKPVQAAPKTYADNLDGWISQALDIMHAKGIPGSYDGVKRNIMRESSGDPQAINNWDVNAQAGIPSKGLLQIIDPTFKEFHVDGTSWDIYDPVANIVASCNYAAKTYGSMDNVNSAY
ncbi:transglycosylase SLT domain-containing protein [Streptomyces sp. NPDC052396]|uniref:transglycosylase SLT domain-containing protein n=1 Tax=Streptomyces sp. NPDC052396 TaxID=3365689 RepID=UPI0037D79688